MPSKALSNIPSIHIAANGKISFFFMAELYSSVCVCVCVCVFYIFFIFLSVDEHLGCFHILASTNNAVMNIEVHISFWISAFGYIARSEIAGTYSSSIFRTLMCKKIVLGFRYIVYHHTWEAVAFILVMRIYILRLTF